ncbi:MAG TPA: hypothetical protein VGJ15_12935 [Pirellulales bacterium]|jgi:hypothetical protein
MLEHNDRKHAAAELIGSFPCLVELPEELRANFEKHGVMPFNENDRRRYPRVFCRSRRNRAGLEYRTTISRLVRESVWHNVYITNVSRDGIGLLHSEPLYPRENMRLLLLNGQLATIEIVNCRRLGPHCFEVGAQVFSGRDAVPESVGAESATAADPATVGTAG